MKNKNSFIKGVFVLSLGGFVAKLLGAFYRIPLTNILGSYGMGIYQLVFPLYALLLTVSSAGIPVAISKLVSEKVAKNDFVGAKAVFRFALIALIVFGTIGSGVLFLFAEKIAVLQGNVDATTAYKLISPSVLLVCIISAFRGYFQGQMNMVPTAVSQVVEQVVKMTLGLWLSLAFLPDVVKGVGMAVLAVTASELVALLYLVSKYAFRRKEVKQLDGEKIFFVRTAKTIFLLALPITLSGIILPLTQLIDSVLVLNILKGSNATQLFGLWSGPVHSLLNLPVVLTLGIATAVVPSVSKNFAQNDLVGAKAKSSFSLKMTSVLALPCAVGLFVTSLNITKILYGGLPESEILLISNLIKVSAASVFLLSLVQTSTAIMQSAGKLYWPVLFLFTATIVKTILSILLLNNPRLNVFGAAIASVACYFVASVLDLLYIKNTMKVDFSWVNVVIKPLLCSGLMAVVVCLVQQSFANWFGKLVATILVIVLGGIVFFAAVCWMKVFSKEETTKVPFLGKWMTKFYK